MEIKILLSDENTNTLSDTLAELYNNEANFKEALSDMKVDSDHKKLSTA